MDNLLPRHTIINIMIVQSSDSYQHRPDFVHSFANDINFPLPCCSFPSWHSMEASYNDLTCKTRTQYKYQGKWHYWWRLDVKILPRRHISVNLQSNILISIIMLYMRCIPTYTHNIFMLQPCQYIYAQYSREGEKRSSGKVQDSKRSK